MLEVNGFSEGFLAGPPAGLLPVALPANFAADFTFFWLFTSETAIRPPCAGRDLSHTLLHPKFKIFVTADNHIPYIGIVGNGGKGGNFTYSLIRTRHQTENMKSKF